MKMRYAIVTNPVAGKMSVAQKRSLLSGPAEILEAEICGLDTTTVDDFCQCTRELQDRCDVLVVAGGDGTFSDVLNAIDTSRIPIAFLPLGTGNAMQHALNYKGTPKDIARRIREGEIREYDLINCDDRKKAFMVSLGIDGLVIKLRSQYRAKGASGFKTYFRAVLNAYFKEYKRTTAKMILDDVTIEMKALLSLMVVKQPYYGFGMKVVPRARFDDGQLHVLCVNEGLLKAALGGMTAFTFENRIGQYLTGRRLTVSLEQPLSLQIDGNEGWESDEFQFTVFPKGLKIKC
jgi:diacylglycerol kinase (ATP)